MPIHFTIVEPRATPPYDLTTETVRVRGTYTGSKPDQMWCVANDGACPTATHNPFQANATEFDAASDGTWEVPGLAIAGDGMKHVRIWSIQPGSHTIEYDDQEYSVESTGPDPSPPTATFVSARKSAASSKSGARARSSAKGARATASQNGSSARPATPAKRRTGKGQAAKQKAAAKARGKAGRPLAAKSKPKANKGKRSR